MEIQKELSELALDWSEEQYRNSEELHYSQLAKYEKVGFAGLDHLFDKEESAALSRGSLLDVILTGTQEEFDRHFFIADFPSIGEKELLIVNKLFDMCGGLYENFSTIPDRAILEVADEFEFQKNWKPETKVKALGERCTQYYNLKVLAKGREIISQKTYEDVLAMANAVRESPSTSSYFRENDPLSPVRRYYQLKFKATLDGVGYVIMADLIVVNYETKKIYILDLKSSGKPEYLFEDSFLYWGYSIQSRLYTAVLADVLSKDEYFKDFEIQNFRFVVVNKENRIPLVWEFSLAKERGILVDDEGNVYRDPLEIGKELKGYLDLRPQVPNGIVLDGINVINCLKVL